MSLRGNTGHRRSRRLSADRVRGSWLLISSARLVIVVLLLLVRMLVRGGYNGPELVVGVHRGYLRTARARMAAPRRSRGYA